MDERTMIESVPESTGCGAAAQAVLCCARSLSLASLEALPRLYDLGSRARLGEVFERCAEVLEDLERAMEVSGWGTPVGAQRVDGVQRVDPGRRPALQIGGGSGVGVDLGLLLELDVLAARLQARIDEVPARGIPAEITSKLHTLSALVGQIRSEYELYTA